MIPFLFIQFSKNKHTAKLNGLHYVRSISIREKLMTSHHIIILMKVYMCIVKNHVINKSNVHRLYFLTGAYGKNFKIFIQFHIVLKYKSLLTLFFSLNVHVLHSFECTVLYMLSFEFFQFEFTCTACVIYRNFKNSRYNDMF